MGLPNDGGENAPVRHLMHSSETSNAGMGCVLLSYWPKVWKPPNFPAITKAIDCSSQSDEQTILLQIVHTYLAEHKEVELAPK